MTTSESTVALDLSSPVLSSRTLNAQVSASLHFKCENFQRAGVFKTRGAFNAVLHLSQAALTRGVVTSSSGNQAAALSLAASTRGIPAYIAMPRAASRAKVGAVQRYGGNIRWVDSKGEVPSSEEYDATVELIQSETRAVLVHPYNDVYTIAGQGTCTLEFLEQQPALDCVLAPVGGGGLLAGTALTAETLQPTTKVIGCEPQMADDAQRSLRAGRIVPQCHTSTIADGLRTSLGDLNYTLIARYVDDIVTVSEEAIIHAMRIAWEVLKITIEPSSAVPLAAVLSGASRRWERVCASLLRGVMWTWTGCHGAAEIHALARAGAASGSPHRLHAVESERVHRCRRSRLCGSRTGPLVCAAADACSSAGRGISH